MAKSTQISFHMVNREVVEEVVAGAEAVALEKFSVASGQIPTLPHTLPIEAEV